jgi:hypothetical protein
MLVHGSGVKLISSMATTQLPKESSLTTAFNDSFNAKKEKL